MYNPKPKYKVPNSTNKRSNARSMIIILCLLFIVALLVFIYRQFTEERDCKFKVHYPYRLVQNGNGEWAIEDQIGDYLGYFALDIIGAKRYFSSPSKLRHYKFLDSCEAKQQLKEYLGNEFQEENFH